MKKIISLLLCLSLLRCLSVSAYADGETTDLGNELSISSAEDFLAFAENCRLDSFSKNLNVILENDIDLSDCEFESIPIFCGSFDGKGHSITGLKLDGHGSVQGLFRYIAAGAVVSNLKVSGDIQPDGSHSQVGGIAGSNSGSIIACSFNGLLSGSEQVGGIAGINTVSGIIDGCSVGGELFGDHFVGGIAGENHGVIRDCVNSSEINTSARQNSVELEDISLNSMTGSEAADTVTDIGGIAGISSGVIRSCSNYGNVGYAHMGYNVGGIAGTQSGYISGCNNYLQIQGRKEVGGIVGQMEPVSVLEYTQDALQILDEQLGAMSGLVNQASYNAQSNANQITGQIGVLQEQAYAAVDAMDVLFSGDLSDPDTIIAAQNALTSAFTDMSYTMNNISAATQNTLYGLSSDLQAISGQINAMGDTLDNASETLGASFVDISDEDTPDMLIGKVEDSVNYGAVLADLNVGGIAGALSVENDLDILEDWEQSGELSMNFEGEIRAVVLNCDNHGSVSGTKQNAGGIAGLQSLGLVKGCSNNGIVDAAEAEYVGGISGRSQGFIRNDYSKCEIHGSSYVGGVAGSAGIVTDCLSMSVIHGSIEKTGALLGLAEDSDADTADPISSNFYLSIREDIGGIDGISYAGIAEPLNLEQFMSIENLPRLFDNVLVRFFFEDGSEKRVYLKPGENLEASDIPSIPAKAGHSSSWSELDPENLTNIVHNISFTAQYTANSKVIESGKLRDKLPLLLALGEFTEDNHLSISPASNRPDLPDYEELVECWEFELSGTAELDSLHFKLPAELEDYKLYLGDSSAQWREAEFKTDGSYIVFDVDGDDRYIAIVHMPIQNQLTVAVLAAALVLLLMIIKKLYTRRKNKCG